MKAILGKRLWCGVIAWIIAMNGLCSVVDAATRQELDTQLTTLTQAIKNKQIQNTDVLNALSVLTALNQSLTTGIVGGAKGTTINLPVYFKEGTKQVAGLQFDLAISSGLTPVSVQPGIAAQAANKTVQGNTVQGGFRVLIFGLNQTTIPTGPVAIIRCQIGASSGLGKRSVLILNMSASDSAGANVPITGKNGSVEVR